MPRKPVQRRRRIPAADPSSDTEQAAAADARWTEPLPTVMGDEAILEAQCERLRQLQAFKATEPFLQPVAPTSS